MWHPNRRRSRRCRKLGCYIAADSKGVIPCVSSSMIEIHFQKEYTTHMFKDIQVQFLKKGDCMVQVLSRQGDMYSLKVAEQKLICDQPVTDTYMVSFDLVGHECHCECNFKNIKWKHTYIKTSHDVNHSDESKNISRGLHSHFFNVTQEFVSDIEEASILHSSLDDSLIKLYDYRASKLQSSVPSRQSSNASESQCAINVDLVLAPPQVSTKGRPSNRRLGAELDKSIRNATR
ncbi:hypothetical protein PIB30_086045 [Stylosanthes scabra]|uniref:Uncharacterized protein n=1 Tax=Stylosanthes scabra TaxID=79078 RepID=A0ABU6WRD5_9FABA|nr:hypothetical protein [Stylosanthes scabra]